MRQDGRPPVYSLMFNNVDVTMMFVNYLARKKTKSIKCRSQQNRFGLIRKQTQPKRNEQSRSSQATRSSLNLLKGSIPCLSQEEGVILASKTT